jgi:hypothetical protein
MSELRIFIGCLGSGKGFRCDKLVEEQNYVKIDFADELRECIYTLFNWRPKNDEEYEIFKKSKCNMSYFKNEQLNCMFDLTGRELLQKMGTEVIRKRIPDFWTECWHIKTLEALRSGKSVCCSDLRFLNELQAALMLKSGFDVKFIFTDYKSDRYSNTNEHVSEKLAQKILNDGFKHEEELPLEYLKKLSLDKDLIKAMEV